MCLKYLGVILLLSTLASAQRVKSLNQMLAWNVLEYGFPTDNDRQYAADNGLLTVNTGTPIDVGIQYADNGNMRVFVTIPRFTRGIPYTLATVSNKLGPNGPIINAYPGYEWHYGQDTTCTKIVSAFRVAIDECNHMWVIDSGLLAGVQICPPKLLNFDLTTDKLIHTYQFTSDVFVPVASLFITPVVDIRDPPPHGRCQNAMVYIADVTHPGLIVYDSQKNAAWRIENKLMFPDPDYGTHTVAGEHFDLMDGIFALALTPRSKKGGPSGERYLYFHPLASGNEVAVSLRLINNQTIWQGNSQAMPEAFRVFGNRGVQAAQEAMDSKGNLYTSTNDPLTVFAWNIYNSPYTFNSFKIVANDPQQLQFASGMKVVKHPLGHEELWLSTCRFQKIATGTQNVNEINFRILACKTDDLLKGRGCSNLGQQSSPHSNSVFSNLVLS